MRPSLLSFALSAACALCPVLVHAEAADRDKPIALEADNMTVDDIKREKVLTGNVIITQGTLKIEAAKVVVTEDIYGFQRGVATSGRDGLARFRQRRDGPEDEWIEGEAERIIYEARTEVAELFVRAFVQSGSDTLRGDYIRYDGLSGQYAASSMNPPVAPGMAPRPSRVRAILIPKKKEGAPAPATSAPTTSNAPSPAAAMDMPGGKP
ncbi:MAG: lipopolysaccharide transport periplasmic protein LptA [Zoogloeaceae bacterium]|nr:lipopolysaccharide transport periplasmic protein LptA [Zoogloeaceae bacterium]